MLEGALGGGGGGEEGVGEGKRRGGGGRRRGGGRDSHQISDMVLAKSAGGPPCKVSIVFSTRRVGIQLREPRASVTFCPGLARDWPRACLRAIPCLAYFSTLLGWPAIRSHLRPGSSTTRIGRSCRSRDGTCPRRGGHCVSLASLPARPVVHHMAVGTHAYLSLSTAFPLPPDAPRKPPLLPSSALRNSPPAIE